MFWELRHTVAHQGPLPSTHPGHNGSPHNVTVEWENGLTLIALDAPLDCAMCTGKKGLLDKPGWKCFERLAKKTGKFFAKANKAKIRQCNHKPKFKCDVEIPRDCAHAVEFDRVNGNTHYGRMPLTLK